MSTKEEHDVAPGAWHSAFRAGIARMQSYTRHIMRGIEPRRETPEELEVSNRLFTRQFERVYKKLTEKP